MDDQSLESGIHVSEDCGIAGLKISEPSDRLSELPDSLILVILSLLPMSDVVMTALLSHRWKDLWTTVPCLDFSNHTNNLGKFRSFVCGALSHWKGSKILKFSVNFVFDQSFASDLDSWLHFAIENQVEELYVDLLEYKSPYYYNGYEDDYFLLPECLSSCSSITKLTIVSNFVIFKSVQWNQLKSLTIESTESFIEHTINQVLAGAPQLEVLNIYLSLMDMIENLDIRSSSLKVLNIDRHNISVSYLENDTMLRICAPNLESLEIHGVSYGRCSMNVPSLTNAILGFRDRDFGDVEMEDCLLGEMIIQVFHSISFIEKVSLSDWCIKVLLEMKKNEMPMPFSNVKILKLVVKKADEMLGVLDLFPNLLMLIVQLEENCFHYIHTFFIVCGFLPRQVLPIPSVLPRLRTVEITWLLRDCMTSVIPAIEILLQKANLLEKMVLTLNSPVPFDNRKIDREPEPFLLAEEKVLSLPRSSPTAQVTVIHDVNDLSLVSYRAKREECLRESQANRRRP